MIYVNKEFNSIELSSLIILTNSIIEDAGCGYHHVVPSPKPCKIVFLLVFGYA